MIQHHGEFLHIEYPAAWAELPAFNFGQQVRGEDGSRGTVFGLEFTAPGSYWNVQGFPAGWSYWVEWEIGSNRRRLEPVENCHQTNLQPLVPLLV